MFIEHPASTNDFERTLGGSDDSHQPPFPQQAQEQDFRWSKQPLVRFGRRYWGSIYTRASQRERQVTTIFARLNTEEPDDKKISLWTVWGPQGFCSG